MSRFFKLPIGFEHNGSFITEFPIAVTTGKAEDIYMNKPSNTKIYSWFAEVIAVSVGVVDGEDISANFIKTGVVPEIIKKLSLLDAGSLMLQIQRECWQDTIKGQEFPCKYCGNTVVSDIDLFKMECPENTGELVKEIVGNLGADYLVIANTEKYADYKGMMFNAISFRVPDLGTAIRHEAVASDEIVFWRKIAFDCRKELLHLDTKGNVVEIIPADYSMGRGFLIFERDLSTKSLREVRNKLQTSLPTAKMFYKDICPSCKKETPYFTSVTNFFLP